jgi:GNAT superfamily N-acetyltransferase
VIRPATPDDARALAELQVRAWQWAYGDFLAEPDMPTVAEREARWRADGRTDTTAVWDQDGRIVALVSAGPARDEGVAEGIGELYALYVDPPAQGAGVGGALHEHALGELRRAGFARAMLWVFADNGHGRAFYESRGWRPDGRAGEALGAATLRYAREL